MKLYELTMPLDWEWMPDEVFTLATHFLLPPQYHPGKGMSLGNENGTSLTLPAQFADFRKSTRVHEIPVERTTLRETAIANLPKRTKEEITPQDVAAALAGSDFRSGDALLIRTGWGDKVEQYRGSDRYMLETPHFSTEAAAHLAQRLQAQSSDLLLVDTAFVSLPDKHLIPQWADNLAMPRPAPWPSGAAQVYLRTYTADRVKEDWAADYELARADIIVVKRLVNCTAVQEGRVRIIVAPLHLVRGIGSTCRVVAMTE